MEFVYLITIGMGIVIASLIKPALSWMRLKGAFIGAFRSEKPPSHVSFLAAVARERLYEIFFRMFKQRRPSEYLFWELGRALMDVFGADGFSVMLTPPNKNWYYIAWSNLYDRKDLMEIAAHLRKADFSNILMVVKSSDVQYINDTVKFGHWYGTDNPVHSWLGIPLIVNGETIGVLSIDWFEKGRVKKWMVGVGREIVKEISKIIESFEEIMRLLSEPNIDPILGIPNLNALREELSRAQSRLRNIGLIYIKIDNFDKLSKVYGNQIGNEVLKSAYKRISETVERKARIFKIGGDEFVLLVDNPLPGSLINFERRISNAFLRIMNVSKGEKRAFVKLNLRIGAAMVPNDTENASELLDKAKANASL